MLLKLLKAGVYSLRPFLCEHARNEYPDLQVYDDGVRVRPGQAWQIVAEYEFQIEDGAKMVAVRVDAKPAEAMP